VTTLDDAIAAPRRSRVRLQPRRPLEAAFGAIFWTVVLGGEPVAQPPAQHGRFD
jgi:hypothetical protein